METLLTGINVVDVRNGSIENNTNLLIRDHYIAECIKDQNDYLSNNQQTKVLDCSGCYVVPGLIDLHVHLMWSGGTDPQDTVEREGLQTTILRAAQNAYKNLSSGITTVRDLGSHENAAIAINKGIENGYINGSRVIPSGMSIIMTGGHDPFWGIEADGIDEVIKAVRKQITVGSKVIKVSATGGVYGRAEGEEVENTELTYEELKAIVLECHRFGLKVAAHSISWQGIKNCVEAKVDSIEHGHFLTEELCEQMSESGLALVPTLYIYKKIAEGVNVPAYATNKAKAITSKHKQAFGFALNKNVLLGSGSDAGSPNLPHPALVDELECMVESGASELKTLQAATIDSAKILGYDGILGLVEKNILADLLIITDNPLVDISSLRKVKYVFKEGQLIR